MRSLAKKETKEYHFFTRAVLNNQWERADELYGTIPDRDFEYASQVIHYLVKQFKNEALERVLLKYRSLDVNIANYKGLAPILISFQIANDVAAKLLRDHGANLRVMDAYNNSIISYAKLSKCRNMVELSQDMYNALNSPPKDFSNLAAKLLARRNNGGTAHYAPDFE